MLHKFLNIILSTILIGSSLLQPANVYAETISFNDSQEIIIDETSNENFIEETPAIDFSDETRIDIDEVNKNEDTYAGTVKQPVYLAGSSATLVSGMIFNGMLKTLAGNTMPASSYSTGIGVNDNAIHSIEWTDTMPADALVVSDGTPEVYAGYNDHTIYLYTTADTVYINPDALINPLFQNMKSLTSVDLGKLTSSDGTRLNNMFANAPISQITFGPQWNFATATDLPENNHWVKDNTSEVWSTAAIETMNGVQGHTFVSTITSSINVDVGDLYTAKGLTSNNMYSVHDKTAKTAAITINRCVRKSFRSILSGTQPVHYRAGVDIEYKIHHYGRPGKLYIQ